MGYCMKMKAQQFFVQTEYVGRVMAKAKNWPYRFALNDEGEITDIEFIGEKFCEDFTFFHSIASYVQDGSYVEMVGEDGTQWRWIFHNGICREVKAAVSWPKDSM